MRGKRGRPPHNACRSRITPARAGKTPASRIAFTTSADHPRACGENDICYYCACFRHGSPPRVRGKHCSLSTQCYRERITPARAGKTYTVDRLTACAADHPRACGENSRPMHSRRATCGSPPRVRGKQRSINASIDSPRITPARAGKTFQCLRPCRFIEDHPRACGENMSTGFLLVHKLGSPPRVRGKRSNPLAHFAPPRITPARAGKTQAVCFAFCGTQDHPRACGENSRDRAGFCLLDGSPPRVRGKRKHRCRRRGREGITPARAGKTLFSG